MTIRLHLVLRLKVSGAVPLLLSVSVCPGQINLFTLTAVDVVPLSAMHGVPYFRKLPSTGDDLYYCTYYFQVLQTYYVWADTRENVLKHSLYIYC